MQLSREITEAIEKTVTELGYDCVEVRFAHGANGDELTVFIDRKESVSLDDCETVSKALDPLLDELDPTHGAPYDLSVSSAGLDRPIRSQRDYDRNVGREVECRLFAPLPGTKQKTLEGVLLGREGDVVRIEGFDKTLYTLQVNRIAHLTQLIKFD